MVYTHLANEDTKFYIFFHPSHTWRGTIQKSISQTFTPSCIKSDQLENCFKYKQ